MIGRLARFPVPTAFDAECKWPWYRLVTPVEAIATLPWGWKERGYGHLYLAVLSNGAIKIGATRKPRQRVNQHVQAVRKYSDLDVDAFYFTAPHTNYLQNESSIHKKFARPLGLSGRMPEVYKTLTLPEALDLIHACSFEDCRYVYPGEEAIIDAAKAQA